MIKVTFEDGTSELRAPDSKVDVDEAFDSELRFYRGETVRVWRGGERVKVLVEAEVDQIARLEGELAAERATLRVAEDAAEKMRDAFIDFDRSIGEAQGAYCNHEHWGPDQWEPIGDARRDFFKAFESRRGSK